MNKTEERYAAKLEGDRLLGEVDAYWFEGIKLKLGKNTFYEVDFLVLTGAGYLECHDVKGGKTKTSVDGSQYAVAYQQDDARVKMMTAAEMYPFKFVKAFEQPRKLGGGWVREEV